MKDFKKKSAQIVHPNLQHVKSTVMIYRLEKVVVVVGVETNLLTG